MPEAFLNIFDFLDYTFFNTFLKNLKQFSRLLVSFASLAESREISIEHPSVGCSIEISRDIYMYTSKEKSI